MDLTSSDWQMRYLETMNGNHVVAAVEKASTMTHIYVRKVHTRMHGSCNFFGDELC